MTLGLSSFVVDATNTVHTWRFPWNKKVFEIWQTQEEEFRSKVLNLIMQGVIPKNEWVQFLSETTQH